MAQQGRIYALFLRSLLTRGWLLVALLVTFPSPTRKRKTNVLVSYEAHFGICYNVDFVYMV